MPDELLFEVAPLVNWEREQIDPYGKAHVHRYGDWTVEHCGHPTALFPWMIYDPEGAPVYAENGRGWQTLKAAKTEVECRAATLPDSNV
jgi:hypothetical protein